MSCIINEVGSKMMIQCIMRILCVAFPGLVSLTSCGGENQATRTLTPVNPIVFQSHLEIRSPDKSGPRIASVKGNNVIGVVGGERITVSITSKESVYAYLGYCKGHEFALFPDKGALRAAAGLETRIPPGEGAFEISGESSSDVLYLILSTQELSIASPELAVKIAHSGQPVDGDCASHTNDAIPPEIPVIARPSDNSIEIVRYRFRREVR